MPQAPNEESRMAEATIDTTTFDSLKAVGDADFVRELIDTFLDDAPRMFTDLRQALTGKNTELFRRTAHSLKSNGNTFGALPFANLAKELEMMAREERLDGIGDRLEKLAAEYARVEAALKSLRDA
jgi:HPt (histidine-containing phosphotransfer) domain-containing protein